MLKTKLSSKGQLIIPKSIRQQHGWHSGLQFMVTEYNDGLLLKPLKPKATYDLDDVVGCTGYKGPKQSLAAMEKAIIKGVKDK